MGASERRTKDQAMAAAMKAAGIERRSGRCPVCYTINANGSHPSPALCKPTRRKGTKGERY